MRSAKRSLVWRVTQCVWIWGPLQKGLMIQPKHGWQWEISHMETVMGSSHHCMRVTLQHVVFA